MLIDDQNSEIDDSQVARAYAWRGPLASSLAEEMPKSLGPFQVLEEMGIGGMGCVYRVEQNGSSFVAKTMHRKLVPRPEWRERFAKEIEIQREIGAPVFVAEGDEEGLPYFVMKEVPGLDLAKCQQAQAGKRLKSPIACTLIKNAAESLEKIHGLGFIHRDITPKNLILRSDSLDITIIDFGISRSEYDESSGLTHTEARYGTEKYMAPEQRQSLKNAAVTADVYALGATLFTLLTNESANYCDNLQADLEKCQVSSQVQAVLRRCLAFDPQERFQSAQELADALKPMCLDNQALAPLLRQRMSRRTMTIGVGAGALTLLGGSIHYAAKWAASFPRLKEDTRYIVMTSYLDQGGKATVWIWDLRTREPWFKDQVNGVATERAVVSRDGSRMLTSGRNGTGGGKYCLWLLREGARYEYQIDAPIEAIGFDSKGGIVLGTQDYFVSRYRAGSDVCSFLKDCEEILSLDTSADGKLALLIRRTNQVVCACVFAEATGARLWQEERTDPFGGCVRFSPDGRSLFLPTLAGVREVDAASGETTREFKIRLPWPARTAKTSIQDEKNEFNAPHVAIERLAVSSKYIVAGCDSKHDAFLLLRTTKTGPRPLPNNASGVWAVDIAAENDYAATGNRDGEVLLWDVQTPRPTKPLLLESDNRGWCTSVAFIPQSR